MSLYKNPKYYEIAFSFRRISSEINFFEAAIKKFSKIKVRNVLELASGNSPYLEEWNKRGYRYYGLDLNSKMIEFVRKKAKEKGISVNLFRENMNRFSLGKIKIDLVYVLLGSFYATSNEEFFRHLDCVSSVLRKGGLYLLNGVVWFNLFGNNNQSWVITKHGIKIKVAFRPKIFNAIMQTFRDNFVLDINDHGVKKQIHHSELHKFFFPQEFLSLIKCHGKFEFLGWFDNFDLHRPATVKGKQIVILRKK